jgi:hypothetical protein
MRIFSFEAEIKKHPELNAAFVEFPYNVEKEFGKKGQVKVLATFDGFEYRGSMVKMKSDCHWIGLTHEVREKIDKEPGDIIKVTVREDIEPRVVELPGDLQELLKQFPEALAVYEKLSYTHRKEYVRWITEAKKVETRETRLHKTIDLLLKGTKTPDNQKKQSL